MGGCWPAGGRRRDEENSFKEEVVVTSSKGEEALKVFLKFSEDFPEDFKRFTAFTIYRTRSSIRKLEN